MRTHAAVAILLATAASLFAGDDDEGGVELLYEFQDGEAPAAAIVLEKRLQLLGIEGATVKQIEDGKRVLLRLRGVIAWRRSARWPNAWATLNSGGRWLRTRGSISNGGWRSISRASAGTTSREPAGSPPIR
ncbi:MAG TPA: hypothetical protein VFY93_05890 [Planctomycetota bacterium]|nr:hypothetical protein [Planctomycetota bacterium]